MDEDMEVVRVMAVASESTVEYVYTSSLTELCPNLNPHPRHIPELWHETSTSAVNIDDHVVAVVESCRPLYVMAVIEQTHPLVQPNMTHDVRAIGKPDDDPWFIVPPSLGGKTVPWNIRPTHNNLKGEQFGNLMLSKYVEIMIRLWLDGSPPGTAYVRYEVALEYNCADYPERTDYFSYMIRFYKTGPPDNPSAMIYAVMSEMAHGLEVHAATEGDAAVLGDIYRLPSDWLFETADASDDTGASKYTEFIRVVGVMDGQSTIEYLSISSVKGFLTCTQADDDIPDCPPEIFGISAVLKKGTDDLVVVEGDDICRTCLLNPDSQSQPAQLQYHSWKYLRLMIEHWLKLVPDEANPFVTFKFSGSSATEMRFSAQFYAVTSFDESLEVARALSDDAIKFFKYLDNSCHKPSDVSFSSEHTEFVEETTKGKKKKFIDSTPVLDLVPVVGGFMDICRGIKHLKNKKVSGGISNIIMGAGNIAFDIAGLGIATIPKQCAKSFVKTVSKRFAGMFAKRVCGKAINVVAKKVKEKASKN